MAIKAVIFDIDGVLIDSVKANAVFFDGIFKELGIRYTQKEYVELNHMTMWDLIRYFSKEKSSTKIRKMWDFAKTYPYQHELVKVPRGANATIKSLANKYKLGVVTARTTSGVNPVLERYRYHKYFKTVIAFEDFKNPKPHPEPLLKALKKLKVKPSEAIYVGDMESDIVCARAAKVTSILFENHYSIIKGAKPDYTVSTFKELLKVINHAK